MVDVPNKVVSFERFRAARLMEHPATLPHRDLAPVRSQLSQRDIEHRERMLHFLRRAAAERVPPKETREVQGRLLL